MSNRSTLLPHQIPHLWVSDFTDLPLSVSNMMSISPTVESVREPDLAVGGEPAGRATPDFALTLKRRAGGTTILVLAGELDLYRAPELERALAEAVEPDAAREGHGSVLRPGFSGYISDPRVRRVVVDLRAVTFL